LDGHPFEEIVSKFQPWLIQEKNSLDGISRIQDQMFPVYFALLYLQQQDHIVIQYKNLLGQEQSIDYPTWGLKEKEKYQRQNKALYEELPKTEFRTDTAYLSIASFAPDKMAKQNRVIHRFFKQCKKKKIGQLIIDLRDNTGGKSTEVEYVMSYLLKDGYNAPHNLIVKRSELSDSRVPWLKHWMVRKMLRLLSRKNEDIQRYVDLMELKNGEVDTLYFKNNMTQKRWIYTGQTHLWVNGMSASAAVNFTQAFQQNQLGTIWGQCIMGNDQGTFGNAAPTQLPHSKITVSIATIRYNYGPDFQFDHPNICPDKRIEYSIENIIHGTDPYWFAIRKKI
jgi:C-terminal processing protease CtpA/Prc